MTNSALIIGHADPDGHLIVEQCRRNLSQLKGLEVSTLIDPKLTADHKAWTKLGEMRSVVEGYRYVFFVDLMFSPKTFVREADALVEFAKEYKDVRFFVLDHHPLPRRRLFQAANVRSVYRSDVYDCAIGPPSPLMILAAACEKQITRSSSYRREGDADIVSGLKRAGSRGSPLAGAALLRALQKDAWEEVAALGREENELHRRPRGIYSKDNEETDALRALKLVASRASVDSDATRSSTRKKDKHAMVYDFSANYEAPEGAPVELGRAKVFPRDLETIATALELGAITLSYEPDATFSKSKLIDAAKEYVGPDADLREVDVDLVLNKLGLVEKTPDAKFRLKSI